MLPPIDSSVLKNNPQFANLYKGLTELILNDDGSTKLHPQNPVVQERKAVTDELNKHRLAATTEHLLIHALSTTVLDPIPIPVEPEFNQNPSLSIGLQPPPPPTIPPNLKQPLTDLLLLLPSFLSLDFSSPETPPLDFDSLLLILTSPPLSLLPTLLPYLGPLLSTTLHSQASHLVHLARRLSHPSISTTTTSNPTSTPPLTIPTLPTTISRLTTKTLPTLHSSLLHSRLATAEAVRDLLSQYSTAFTLLIKTLEAKHGPIARSLEFKASETALLAEKAEKESELAVLGVKREVYTPEVRKCLGEYKKWLVGEQERIRGEIERGEEVLGGYGVEVHIEEEGGGGYGGGEGEGYREGEGEGEEKKGGEGKRGGDVEKEKVMREIARVYAQIEREVEVVRRDLERLGLQGV
ncbi:hypothetical protein GE21DRAFT_3634 [Neurospora crassa]|uniref:Uncharacterized protein n=1 Tax=Neurospora crassa (strain ATCC 24698 / 74-OR23-1A / CBS 708.71 / DSM 1257 / FGSC 987) TaxID=367110 RepID=V5INJ5_NEUCR|nr:hypothetical protein NCU16588 [Neurospora crassa OR74A]ESA43708.1 hypothetical protein NCU16588 [Neurospora crassa OR74A]KHE82391.1 hypothetical protein GE21DRAFT_3634 [Neurospora crassa]|eukprot:XP_011393709.1 hypothetical protein NCU16588 [Neurospora crassa OR74A]